MTPGRPRFGLMPIFGSGRPTFSMPGQQLGSASPLASPSLGLTMPPSVAIAAAVAGAHAAYVVTRTPKLGGTY